VREEVRQAAETALSDAKLVQATTDIRSAEADDPDGSVSDAAYATAFRQARLDVDAIGPEAVGARIRAMPSGVATALAAALDDWALQRRKARPGEEAGWRRPIDAARAADPDATRDRLRDLWSQADLKARRAPLLDLAKQADPRGWPPASLILLARALYSADLGDAAVELLRRAQVHQPGDVWLNYGLARWLDAMNPPQTEEAIAYYTAARAVRPETAHELAHLLERRGRVDEAAAVFADLVRLRPGDARHRLCYGRLLKTRGDSAGATAAIETSVAALRAAIREKPDDASAHANLASALRSQGKVAEAVAEYRQALALGLENALTRVNLGQALCEQGKTTEAIDEFRQAIRLEPDSATPHLSLGTILCDEKHDYAAAETEFRTAIRLRPGEAEAYGDLGNALKGLGKLDEAIAAYRAALRLRPDLNTALFNLGGALSVQGKVADAIGVYREAIRLRPGVAWPHVNLGAILCDVRRDYARAEEEFRAAIRIDPDLAVAHNNLGNALSRQGKVDEAIAAHREAIRLRPDYAEAHSGLGVILCDLKQDYTAAEAEFRVATRLRPDYAEAHSNLGVALRGQGKVEDGIAAFRAAIRIKPDHFDAHANLGSTLRGLGKLAEAIVAFRDAIRLRPVSAALYTELGAALYAQGKRGEAEAEFREAVRLKPDDYFSHDWLGYVLAEGGQKEAAIPEFRRAIELKPDYTQAYRNLAAALMDLGRTDEVISAYRAAIRIKPRDGAEGLLLAGMALKLERYGAVARLYSGAFEADPKLAANMASGNRYNAACAAALAAAGRGEGPLRDEAEKAPWRKRAIAWLEADLASWRKQVEGGRSNAAVAAKRALLHWKQDADLAGLRDPEALARLQAEDQQVCRKLWSDVDALLARVGGA
jgi:tetratricopeptide (TPR) repeat protein